MELNNEKMYNKKMSIIRDLIWSIIILSNASGGIETSGRYIRSTQIFTKLSCLFYSFLRLLPGNPVTNDEEIFWDWTSIAILARAIMETYNAFFYVGVDNISEDEVRFGFVLMEYHRYSEMLKLYDGFGVKEQDLHKISAAMLELKKELELSSVLIELRSDKCNKNLIKNILNGRVAMHLTHAQIDGRAHVLGKKFEPYYRLFSNQVHVTPFAFRMQSNEIGRGDKNDLEMYYILAAIDVVVRYMCVSIVNIADIFHDKFSKHFFKKHVGKAMSHMETCVP